MLKKTLITLLSGTTLLGLLIYPFNLSRSVAQDNQTTLITQSSPEINFQELKGFKGVIVTLGVTPNGKTLIVASNDGQITAVDLENLELKYSQRLRANPYSDIAFSSDGKLFAVTNEENIVLFDTEKGKKIRTLQGHSSNVSNLSISPDNRILVSVSGNERTIKVWNLERGNLIQTIGEGIGPVTTVAFSPDSKFFVTGSIGTERLIKFWDTETLELLNTSEKQPGYIYSVAITPDGKELVAAVRNFVKVWDLSSTKEILSLKGPQLDINKIAVSPDNRLVAIATREGKVMIMDIVQGELLGTLKGHEGWVQSVTFSPDGQYLFSGAEDKIVKIWDISNL